MSVLSNRFRRSATTWTFVTQSNYHQFLGRKNCLQLLLGKAKVSAYSRTLSSSNNDDNNSNNPNINTKQQSATKEVRSAGNINSTNSSSSSSSSSSTFVGSTENRSPFQLVSQKINNSQIQRFYLLDVSPYLDPLAFCRSSASYECLATKHTIDGTLAARRLNRGKQMVRDFIKYQLCSYFHLPDRKKSKQQHTISNEQYILANLRAQHGNKRRRTQFQKPKNKHPQPFILSGHGIPKQLLLDHLHLCQQVILHLQGEQIMTGKECFFHHSCSTTTTNSLNNNSTGTNVTVDINDVILHVRNKGYKNQVIPWPLPPSNNDDSITNLFHDRFVLYVTVMNRLSTTLVQMLTSPNKNHRAHAQEYWHQQNNQPSYWNVHFCIRDGNKLEPNDFFHYINDHNNLNSLSSQSPTMQLNNDKQPIIVAQLSERVTSCGMKASTVTNVRIQMHGIVPKTAAGCLVNNRSVNGNTSNSVDVPDRVSMFYEACFYSNK